MTPPTPIIFNTAVDAVARAVLDEVCGPQEAQHGLGWAAGEIKMMFYAEDDRIAGWDHEWVHDALMKKEASSAGWDSTTT